jgi:Nif-specific regulatory protein
VCATHRDLDAEVAAGRFRQDLYYRIKVVEIHVPSLRERGPDEIETLARHFADMYSRRYATPHARFSDEALQTLRRHDWPGNVRELEHWVESAVVLSSDGVLRGDHVAQAPPGAQPSPAGGGVTLPVGLSLEEVEKRYIAATVEDSDGNRTEAARRLGIGRNTITRKLNE